MALSMTTALQQIRTLVAAVTGMSRVYGAGDTGANGLPMALNELPCALVFPGPDMEYILSSGQHRHTYLVKVQIFEGGGALDENAATVLPLVDAIIEKFAVNVTLGNRVNSCIYSSQSGYVGLKFASGDYAGYEINLEVSEQASATPAAGS